MGLLTLPVTTSTLRLPLSTASVCIYLISDMNNLLFGFPISYASFLHLLPVYLFSGHFSPPFDNELNCQAFSHEIKNPASISRIFSQNTEAGPAFYTFILLFILLLPHEASADARYHPHIPEWFCRKRTCLHARYLRWRSLPRISGLCSIPSLSSVLPHRNGNLPG